MVSEVASEIMWDFEQMSNNVQPSKVKLIYDLDSAISLEFGKDEIVKELLRQLPLRHFDISIYFGYDDYILSLVSRAEPRPVTE